jgi:2-methylisocitrate lyase-like PEP mutase family enzyme
MPERQRMTARLKTLFQRPELFVLAGGINPIGAKMAEALGYDAFYMSGGNTSAHQLGWPDSGTSMRDMVDNAMAATSTPWRSLSSKQKLASTAGSMSRSNTGWGVRLPKKLKSVLVELSVAPVVSAATAAASGSSAVSSSSSSPSGANGISSSSASAASCS